MKILFSFYLLLCSIPLLNDSVHFKYCFGFSKTIDSKATQRQVFYTDIMTTSCSAEDAAALTNKWAALVNKNCLSKCSSDFNLYNSESEANEGLQRFFNQIKDSATVQITKLSLD